MITDLPPGLAALYADVVKRVNVHDRWRRGPQYFISSSLAGRCLLDEERTSALMRIVGSAAAQGGVAADLGAGTGILGFTAALAGARHVDLVESDPVLSRFLHDAAAALGYARRDDGAYAKGDATIAIHGGDARSFAPSRPLDMVLCELVDNAGLSDEHIVPALQQVRGYAAPDARFYPESARLSVRLYHHDFTRWPECVSVPVTYADVDFRTEARDGIDTTVRIEVNDTRRPWMARLETSLGFPGGERLTGFHSLCSPLDVVVTAGMRHSWPFSRFAPGEHLFGISYRFGVAKQRVTLRYLGAAVPGAA